MNAIIFKEGLEMSYRQNFQESLRLYEKELSKTVSKDILNQLILFLAHNATLDELSSVSDELVFILTIANNVSKGRERVSKLLKRIQNLSLTLSLHSDE